jgi:hypothetical protein
MRKAPVVRDLFLFRLIWTALIVTATTVPYLLNAWMTPTGYHYTWVNPPYPADSFGYMAWTHQAANGAWLFKIKFTALPHDAFLFHPFFLVCGWLSALFSCDIGIVFLVAKALGSVLLLAIFFRYEDYLRLNPTQSITAAVLLGVSSGLGGILAVSGWIDSTSPCLADLWMPEMSTFWSLLSNPLFPWSLALLLLSIYWFDRGTAQGRSADLWLSGLAAGVMTLIHPYAAPLVFTMAAIIAIIRSKKNALGYLLRYYAAAAPFAIYVVLASRSNALVAKHTVTGEMKSPALIAYIVGFGLPLLFFIVGSALGREKLVKRYWQLVVWFLLSILFAYVPFWFQRKLVFGAHIPLCILVAVAFDFFLGKWSTTGRRRVVTIAAAVVLLPVLGATPIYLLITQYRQVKANSGGAYFVNNEIIDGLKALQQRSRPDDVVFASIATSRLIPAVSGNTVLWGHWAMSVDLPERQNWAANIFNAQSDDHLAQRFWGSDIRFVFADGDIKQWLETHPYMAGILLKDASRIFENRSVVIYKRPDALF